MVPPYGRIIVYFLIVSCFGDNHPSTGFDTDAVHQNGHGPQKLRHPAPVVGEVDIDHVKILQGFGLFQVRSTASAPMSGR
jgi:hypothetical protein